MKVGILVFPGTNCEADLNKMLQREFSAKTQMIWHEQSFEANHDIYFIAGGFSYGDYLRSGAMASIAKSIESLKKAILTGRKVIGICNGFQILTESQLLPGALIRNKNLKHICKWVGLTSQNKLIRNKIFEDFYLPISHSEGNFYCEESVLKNLQDEDNILFQYKENINGSTGNIAGIKNKENTIFGMMPHPERTIIETKDSPPNQNVIGKKIIESILGL